MQTHTQMVQTPQVMVGGLSHPMKAWPKAWHGATDNSIRLEIFSQILHLLRQRGVERNLQVVAKDVERSLYFEAASKEEYGDFSTLEHRICSLMIRLRAHQNPSQHVAQLGSLSSKAQLPAFSGMLSPGSSTTTSAPGSGGVVFHTGSAASGFPNEVQPTPGLATNFIGRNPPVGVSGSAIGQYKSNLSVQNIGSWMVPTPGLNLRNNVLSSNQADVPFSGGSMETRSELPFTPNSGFQYHGGKISPGSLLSNNAQLGNMSVSNGIHFIGQEQGVAGGMPLYNNPSNMRQGFMEAHSHHVGQSLLQQHLHGADGHMRHVNSSLEGYNMYNTKFSTGVSSLSSAPTNSSLSEQPEHKISQGFQSQGVSHVSSSAESHVFSAVPNHEQGRSLIFSNQCSSRIMGDSDALSSLTVFGAPGDQCNVLQPQGLQSFENQRNQEVNWIERGVDKQCHLQCEPQNAQHSYAEVLYTDGQVEHSGQACQANSADTGQSEVVSNDEAPSQVKELGKLLPSQEVKRRQWLLAFLWHVSRCPDSGSCNVERCAAGREMWTHLKKCKISACSQKCRYLKMILKHHQNCRNLKCAVCVPVRTYIAHQAATYRNKMSKEPVKQMVENLRDCTPNEVDSSPPMKRMKVENPQIEVVEPERLPVCDTECQKNHDTLPLRAPEVPKQSSDQVVGSSSLKSESPIESSVSEGPEEDAKLDIISVAKVESSHSLSEKDTTIKMKVSVVPGTDRSSTDSAAITTMVPVKASSDSFKVTKAKISGISYIENFTAEQIRQHITSLRKWIGQSRCKAEKNQAMQHQQLKGACSACAVEDLFFDPIPNFCTQCGCRIKRNATYYTSGAGENSLSFCGPCYNSIRTDTVETDGFKLQKSMLIKKKNDEQRAEGWVECDKCQKWQHQICVLFNARMNKERLEYICPHCCAEEMEIGERVPEPVNPVPGAKDLPSTVLSDYIQKRLSLKLQQERSERAQALGKSSEEVPTAEGLVVRVLSSVDKKLEVKPRFMEIFQEENYPKDFLYKSKMLMLFQEIEGVEVCLFGMYVQEFGAEMPQPNHRWVYLSYLDSVKYFRPDVRTVKGEALRTYVYHEILIAYLDYCKKRGFSSCYIWACPPLKGDDYILYCHPEIQKTPKTDKLREWYLNMISKAKREKVVVANKNLYDYFFTSNGDCRAKVTAARLPYFDGDYWPGAAEDLLHQLQQEDDGVDPQKRAKIKKIAPKRTTKTSAQAELGGNVSMDNQLMHKLGQSILAMKEDFMIVQLHHACSRCRMFIYSGHRWVCHQCAGNFQLCSSCYNEHQNLDEEDKHPAGKKESHHLRQEEIDEIPIETVDNDEIMESEFFDNRQAFLNLCQGNQYQFDTLRRAKHSSMMILYHLHNPNAPAFVTSCSVCHSELEAGQGYRCKSCTDFDVCHTCYSSSQEVQRHPHEFVARYTATDSSSASSDMRKQRTLQVRMMLEVLLHASKCREPSCQFAKCRNMKDLFRHGNACTKRATGGCPICKRIWFLLTAHSRGCKESVCTVPRCMDLRKHMKRAQLQQESRRRAAVNEMIRQRAAEAAGCQ